MKKTESEIVMIETQRLQHHPDNPRKDLGDVTELADSIKKNGIMQNLTVIPIECTEYDPEKQLRANKISPSSNFYVLIGNRRLEACLQAGLEEVPCRIVSNISKKEQVGIMLEENMQRSDLTIIEQAEGFGNVRFVESTEAKIWKDESCPEGKAVFSTLVVGLNAYATTKVEGGGLQTIIKQLGSGEDPLNQRATVGWKAIKTAKILVEPYMVRIESLSAYSADVDAN